MSADAIPSTTIAIIGASEQAREWARVLRGVDGVETEQLSGIGEDDFLESLSRDDVDAVALIPPLPDLAGMVKRAVMAGRHVFVAGTGALASKQLLALDALSQRRGRVIIFDDGNLADARLAFLRKMTAGSRALWRPRYVRSLRAVTREQTTLDEVAMLDIAVTLGVMDGPPDRVTALGPRADDESGGADAAMLLMSYGSRVAQVDVSMVEPQPRRELTVVCDGRTVVLDDFDVRAPLQIHAPGAHQGPERGAGWSETVMEHPAAVALDRKAAAAEAFVAAAREGDVAETNARTLAAAALVWERARESMRRLGEPVEVTPSMLYADAARPVLQVIEGGGRVDEPRRAPALTVVGRR